MARGQQHLQRTITSILSGARSDRPASTSAIGERQTNPVSYLTLLDLDENHPEKRVWG